MTSAQFRRAMLAILGFVLVGCDTGPTEPSPPVRPSIRPTTQTQPTTRRPCDVEFIEQWTGDSSAGNRTYFPEFNIQFRCTGDREGGIVLVSTILKASNGQYAYRQIVQGGLSRNPLWLCNSYNLRVPCHFTFSREYNVGPHKTATLPNGTSFRWRSSYKVCGYDVPCQSGPSYLWPQYPDLD